jgi:hypothetical protein
MLLFITLITQSFNFYQIKKTNFHQISNTHHILEVGFEKILHQIENHEAINS